MYIVNLYAPNVEKDKSIFFKILKDKLNQIGVTRNDSIILGGDWNSILDSGIDKSGGRELPRDTITMDMKSLLLELEVTDIWRLKNPMTKRFTYRQRQPLIQSRLDYFMITNNLIDMVKNVQINSSFCSDHSSISLQLSYLPKQDRGNSFWKFNVSLISDEEYVTNLKQKLREWNTEYEYLEDKSLKWDLIKYKIRKFSFEYSIKKRKFERETEEKLNRELNDLEITLGNNPNEIILENFKTCRDKLNQIEEEKSKGSIVRSKINWLEQGEKPTKYFFDLEKYNYGKKTIRKLNIDTNNTITSEKEILSNIAQFYSNLYKSKNVNLHEFEEMFFNYNIPFLTENESNSCEGNITEAECLYTLKTFKNNKTPGNDGLSKEFYLAFWEDIAKALIDSYLYSFNSGSMSTSQRQAIITLLEKNGKDRTFLTKLRPISLLLNFDYKLLTKVIANRIKNVLPQIISTTQTGYVKERTIEDSVRYIQDIINFVHSNNSPGILLMIDFNKAFDSIEWNFILNALRKFNFGPNIIKWVKIFYNNISSCVMNNGHSSNYFMLSRGVRQGDPLSPYLFIIAIELLSIAIKTIRKYQELKSTKTKIK